MTVDRNDEPMSHVDHELAALLRRADPARGIPLPAHLTASVLDAASFTLARRRRDARTGIADLLAGWVRVAIPVAAAAAIVASLYLGRIEASALADADMLDSDPGALLSVLDSDGSTGLAQYLIGSDAEPTAGVLPDSR